MNRPRAWLAATCLSFVVSVGCSASDRGDTTIVLPSDGHCDEIDVWKWATMASESLTTRPFVSRPLYDLDAADRPVVFTPGPCALCEAVVSYPDPLRHRGAPDGFERMKGRSYLYDNALYALLRTAEGRQSSARAVLDTLVALQRSDGAWGFSFMIEGGGFYNAGYVRSGAVAWVVYAMARYELRFSDDRYRSAMRRAGAWLSGRIDRPHGLIRGGLGRWVDDGAHFDPLHVAPWMSTEHNVDAAFAMAAAARADPEGGWIESARVSAAIELHTWLPYVGHYARGKRPDGVDAVVALDTVGTWTALFEIARGRPARARSIIAHVDALLGGRQGSWRIWRPGDDAQATTWFVDGSVARAIALHRVGEVAAARADLHQLAQWGCAGGLPLCYSSRWVRDFPRTPAVAPTVWFVLAARELLDIDKAFLWNEGLGD